MVGTYKTSRKLQEQSGSYFVILPKLWVESRGLKQGDQMSVVFNSIVKIKPPPDSLEQPLDESVGDCGSDSTEGAPLSHTIDSKGGEFG